MSTRFGVYMSKIAVLLPAYNEEKNVGKVIDRAKKFLKDALIVVVDDGSSDKTYEVAKQHGATVLRHEKNKGKGEALKTGFNFLYEKGVDYVIVADSDGQYDLAEANKLLRPLFEGKADFVMGKRRKQDVPFLHKLGNFVWRVAFNVLYGVRLKDTNCGYIAMNRRALKVLRKVYGGYIVENAMLDMCVREGLKIAQVEVKVKYKKVSGVLRGVRMVLGVLIYIVIRGLDYRLSRLTRSLTKGFK